MATVPLQDIQFPGLNNLYTVPQLDAELNTTGKAADAKAAGDAIAAAESHVGTLSNLTTTAKTSAVAAVNELDADMETKAEIDGAYESMTVGNAEQLVSTVFTDDNEPYNFRTAGGNADIGDRLYEKIVGGTVAWNQLSDNSRESAEVNGITYTNNGDGSITANGTATATASFNSIEHAGVTAVVGHVYLVKGCPSGGNGSAYYVQEPFTGGSNNVDAGNGRVIKRENTSTRILAQIVIANGTTVNNLVFKPQLFDLTAMFGSTIADYIYSLETANAGAGVAWFRKLCPKDYYAYDAGSLQSVQAKKHVTVGFNQFDESNLDNLTTISKVGDHWTGTVANWIKTNGGTGSAGWENIRYIDGAQYCISMRGTLSSSGTTNVKIQAVYTDGTTSQSYDDILLPGETKTIYLVTTAGKTLSTFRITYGSGTTATLDVYWINVNLHWDGERDGEYEPYVKHEYPLADITLRGIPKLDASNHLYYDGDTYESDGTVTRKYGIVDLGTLTWTYYASYSSMVAPVNGKLPYSDSYTKGLLCDKYPVSNYWWTSQDKPDKTISNGASTNICIKDSAYTDAAAFKTAMSGAYLVYELAEPTTETADPFQSPQVVDDFGTEEYVDAGVTASTPTRDVAIPVGHESQYSANLRAKLEMAPDSPSDGDGDYLVRQTSGENEYVKYVSPVPTLPSEDGTYTLKVTVSGSTKTVAWVADE